MLTLNDFNALKGTHYKEDAHNTALIAKLNAMGATAEDVRAWDATPYAGKHKIAMFAKDYRAAHGTRRTQAAQPAQPAEPKAEPMAAPQDEPQTMPQAAPQTAPQDAQRVLDALAGLLKPAQIDREEVLRIVREAVADEMRNAKPQTITIKAAKCERTIQGIAHKELPDILDALSNGCAVYLKGPAGTGKTHLAKQAAEALGKPFYYSGQVDMSYNLVGYTDAGGEFHDTRSLYKWAKDGGLYFFDEMDASAPDALTAINGLLANGYFVFDDPIGKVELNPECVFMAAGNTWGNGADATYTARARLDQSTLNRFMYFVVDYDKQIENSFGEDAAEFVRAMRKSAERAGIDIVLSYRNIERLEKFATIWGEKKTIQRTITLPMNKDDINILKRDERITALAESGNRFAAAFAAM